jgi:membrane-associated phospholipid phosphatase
MLASRNVATLPGTEASRTALQAGLTLLTVSTAWARVEAKQHFPSDVLFGAALGNFIGAFMHEAFLGLNGGVTIHPARDGVMLGVYWPW